MACSTAGLIPDAVLGVQGAAFVCLLALGVLSQNEGWGTQAPSLPPPALSPAPFLLSTPAGTYSVPTRDLWRWPARVVGNALPIPRPEMWKCLPLH